MAIIMESPAARYRWTRSA